MQPKRPALLCATLQASANPHRKCNEHTLMFPMGPLLFRAQRGRASRYTEEMEDEELLRDEDDPEGEGGGHRLTVQPSCIKGGTMREYQLQGLNWMIHLYDNG